MSDKGSNTRPIRRALMAICGLLASLFVFFVGAGVALAHNSLVSASVDCSRVVQWTASAWVTADPNARTNDDVKVWYVAAGSSTEVEVPGSPGSFNAANGFEFSG